MWRAQSGPRATPRETASLLRFGATVAWCADRRRVVAMLVLQLLSSTGLVVQLLAGKAALTGAFAPQPDQQRVAALLGPLVIIGLVQVGKSMLTLASSRVGGLLSLQVERAAVGEVLDAAVAVELAHFESPEFFDRVNRALSAAATQPITVVRSLGGMVSSVSSSLGVIGVMASIAPWLIPLLVVAALPTWWALSLRRREQYELQHALSANRRLRYYVQHVLTGRDEAKEVRAFGLAPALRRRWETAYDEARELTACSGREPGGGSLRRSSLRRRSSLESWSSSCGPSGTGTSIWPAACCCSGLSRCCPRASPDSAGR